MSESVSPWGTRLTASSTATRCWVTRLHADQLVDCLRGLPPSLSVRGDVRLRGAWLDDWVARHWPELTFVHPAIGERSLAERSGLHRARGGSALQRARSGVQSTLLGAAAAAPELMPAPAI